MLNVRPTMPKARPAAGSGPAFGNALIGRFTRLAPLGRPVWKLIGKPPVATPPGGSARMPKPGPVTGPKPRPRLAGAGPVTVTGPRRESGWVGVGSPPRPLAPPSAMA